MLYKYYKTGACVSASSCARSPAALSPLAARRPSFLDRLDEERLLEHVVSDEDDGAGQRSEDVGVETREERKHTFVLHNRPQAVPRSAEGGGGSESSSPSFAEKARFMSRRRRTVSKG